MRGNVILQTDYAARVRKAPHIALHAIGVIGMNVGAERHANECKQDPSDTTP
jgi:hypothetical protein